MSPLPLMLYQQPLLYLPVIRCTCPHPHLPPGTWRHRECVCWNVLTRTINIRQLKCAAFGIRCITQHPRGAGDRIVQPLSVLDQKRPRTGWWSLSPSFWLCSTDKESVTRQQALWILLGSCTNEILSLDKLKLKLRKCSPLQESKACLALYMERIIIIIIIRLLQLTVWNVLPLWNFFNCSSGIGASPGKGSFFWGDDNKSMSAAAPGFSVIHYLQWI